MTGVDPGTLVDAVVLVVAMTADGMDLRGLFKAAIFTPKTSLVVYTV